MSNLIFNNNGMTISVNENGLYSLNDLHKLSGGEANKSPSQWFRLDETKELIKECESLTVHICRVKNKGNVIEVKEGRYGGTYAHELLLVSYAGWISAKFQLYINQVFLKSERERIAELKREKEKIEQENKQLLEFKDDSYRRSMLENHLNSRFPSQSEKVAKDIKTILRIIKNQGKEVFERIKPLLGSSSEKSHREAWEYLEREGIIVKANKSCRFTGAPMYRIAK